MHYSLLLAFSAMLAAPCWADAPKVAKRTLEDPRFEKFYPEKDPKYFFTRADFDRAIRLAEKEFLPRLNAAESITIYSLLPEFEGKPKPGEKLFHGYRTLGSKQITQKKELATWRTELTEGLTMAGLIFCFEPRHGMRIQTKKSTVDLVICFSCAKMSIYGLPKTTEHRLYFFDPEVQQKLNQFLDDNGIKHEPMRFPQESEMQPAQSEVPK